MLSVPTLMTSSADLQSSFKKALDLPPPPGEKYFSVSEVVFVQDRTGRYLSMHAQPAYPDLEPGQIAGTDLTDRLVPLNVNQYLERIQRVLCQSIPEQFSCHFHYGDQLLLLELVMSPVLALGQVSDKVVVSGKILADPINEAIVIGSEADQPQALLLPDSDRYQKLLTQLTRTIRRSLDLPTIWKQTATILGESLGVSRCIVCTYEPTNQVSKVVAEYCRAPLQSVLGQEIRVSDNTYLEKALSTSNPICVEIPVSELASAQSWSMLQPLPCEFCCQGGSGLIIASFYQDQPNGLIILCQCDKPRSWSELELELMQELADQVGTAIAHATLLSDSQALALDLQQANTALLKQHRELEDARHQAEEASRLKSEFLANTSHELRTPLNGMIGFLKLITDGMADDPVEQTEFIQEAYRSALHLLNIINDVLDIAKIEAGKLQIELTPVRLEELLSDVEDFTRGQVQQKNLSFEVQTPPTDDEIILYGNYQRLLQVMLNLVGNAIKFTHEGGITIGVELVKKKIVVNHQELPGLVKVRVADTGIGVSLDKQDKLFQSFSQVDGSRTRQYGGTGLGLAISQKLVEAMGGVVNFYSMGEGLGSTVTFTVPLYQEPVMIMT